LPRKLVNKRTTPRHGLKKNPTSLSELKRPMRLRNAINEQLVLAMPPQYVCITQGKELIRKFIRNPIKLLLAQTK